MQSIYEPYISLSSWLAMVIMVTVSTASEGPYSKALKEAEAIERLSANAGSIDEILNASMAAGIRTLADTDQAKVRTFRDFSKDSPDDSVLIVHEVGGVSRTQQCRRRIPPLARNLQHRCDRRT